MASTKPRGKQPKNVVPHNDPLYVHKVASGRHLNIEVEIAKAFASPANEQPTASNPSNPIV